MIRPSGIIIDDEPDLAEGIQSLLEMNGFEILGIALDGCTGFDLFKNTNPDFVILDKKMPNYDGDYAAKKIKEYSPNSKIILFTGLMSITKQKNVEKILVKPCEPKLLIDTINELLC